MTGGARCCASRRKRSVSWRVGVVLAAVLLAGCGWPGRASDEDRHRRDVLRDDAAAALQPPDVVSSEPPTNLLATTDNAQLAGCCNSGVGISFVSAAEPMVIMRSYAADLERLGWSDVLVDCYSQTSQISALKQFDTFVGRFRAEVSHTGPPHIVFQSVVGRYHTRDYPSPTGTRPDLSCLHAPEG